MRDWSTQYKVLEVRVQGALEEYRREMATKVASEEVKDAQSELCRRLRDKVGVVKASTPVLLQWNLITRNVLGGDPNPSRSPVYFFFFLMYLLCC